MYASKQDMQGDNGYFKPRNTTGPELVWKTNTIDEISAQLARISLNVRKEYRRGASGSRINRSSAID